MFRKPRDAAAAAEMNTNFTTLPSTGRPPTPPSLSSRKTSTGLTANIDPKMASMKMPLLGRGKTVPNNPLFASTGKAKGKPNGNIMNFFKRAESSTSMNNANAEKDEALFVEDSPIKPGAEATLQTPTPPRDEASPENGVDEDTMMGNQSPLSRFNEEMGSVKRRKTENVTLPLQTISAERHQSRQGPFLDDSEDEADQISDSMSIVPGKITEKEEYDRFQVRRTPPIDSPFSHTGDDSPLVPRLKMEATSVEMNDFDGIEDFIDDEFPEEGEEYMERRWMEEQAQMELAMEDEEETETRTVATANVKKEDATVTPQHAASTVCPICGGNTTGMVEQVCLPCYLKRARLNMCRKFLSTSMIA